MKLNKGDRIAVCSSEDSLAIAINDNTLCFGTISEVEEVDVSREGEHETHIRFGYTIDLNDGTVLKITTDRYRQNHLLIPIEEAVEFLQGRLSKYQAQLDLIMNYHW